MHFVDNASELLADVADQGFAVGLGDFSSKDVDVHTNYRSDWRNLYFDQGWITQDPVVMTGMRTLGFSEWPDPAKSQNIVIRTAADHGIAGGVTISNRVGGHSCIVGLSLNKPLTKAARSKISKTIQRNHIHHLIARTEILSTNQVDLVALFANGLRAKQVAELFEVSEEAIKQRKSTIQNQLGVNNFLVVVNLCAMAGLTLPRIS